MKPTVLLKSVKKAEKFISNPQEFLLTEDHNYDAINAKNAANNNQKGDASDKILFGILKDLRKK